MANSQDYTCEDIQLEAECELRLTVDDKSKVTIELISGLAEVFGTELLPRSKYVFLSNAKVAIFTWRGCTLTISGKPESKYIAKETGMVIYANVHAAIEQLRQVAEERGFAGPKVLVAGPTDVGKSTLCRFLLNYAVRQGRNPVFVDLDIGQGQISVPGTIGALMVETPADAVDGFFQRKPLVYHYGHKSPGHNISLYNLLVSRLAKVMNARAVNNVLMSVSGVVINTCGWIKNNGYRAITHAVLAFEVDVLLVIGHERLFHQLTRDVPAFVKIVYIPKSGGAVERSHSERIESRDSRVREYFYGFTKPLHPHAFDVKFSDVRIYKIARQKQDSLEAGTEFEENDLCLVPVQVGFHLLNHVLSVTFCSSVEDNAINSNVAGFICVTRVDLARQNLTVLSPQPPPLPQCLLLYSDVTFAEEY